MTNPTSRQADVFFEKEASLVTTVARQRYDLELQGEDADAFEGTKVIITPTSNTPEGWHDAKFKSGQLTIAARVVTRLAHNRDKAERGGFMGAIARGELILSGLIDQTYIGGPQSSVRRPGGLIDQVRGKAA